MIEDSIVGDQQEPAASSTDKSSYTEYNDVCPPPSADTSCISVTDYNHFRQIIQSAPPSARLIFCDFALDRKDEDATAWIKSDLQVICQSFGGCTISGPGLHIGVIGKQSKGMIQGFTFTGASESAVRIMDDADTNEHKICHCDFLR